MIALDMGIKRGTITEEFYNDIINELKLIPEKVQKILDQHDEIKRNSKKR